MKKEQLLGLWVPVITLVVVVTLSVYFAAGFFRSMGVLGGSLFEAAGDLSLDLESDVFEKRDTYTFLIYGVDAGEWPGGRYREGRGRADTIVLLRVFPEEQRAAMLSIPRDTMVLVPGREGVDKVNHAYAYGEAALLRETVEDFTGLIIDYHVGLNYRAFKDIVDLLEGVEFEVDEAIASRSARFEAGVQVLDGDKAFSLVRFRSEPLGDIARVERQQRFIRAVVREAGERPPESLFYVMIAAWRNISTDIDLTEAVGMAFHFRGITEEDIVMETVPGDFDYVDGVSYWRPDRDETFRIIEELFEPQNGEEAEMAEEEGSEA